MTEEEKDKLRQAKIEVTKRLAATPIAHYQLCEVDARVEEYAMELAQNPEAHNL